MTKLSFSYIHACFITNSFCNLWTCCCILTIHCTPEVVYIINNEILYSVPLIVTISVAINDMQLLCQLLGSHTVNLCKSLMKWSLCLSSVCLSVVCLSRIISPKLNETGVKFHRLYRKSGSPSKNMTSNFAPEVAKYAKSCQFWECASLLFRSVSDAAFFI